MTQVTLRIEGMSCQHCVSRVKKALDALTGMVSAEVEIGSARISYDESRLTSEEIKAAVVKAGYKVA